MVEKSFDGRLFIWVKFNLGLLWIVMHEQQANTLISPCTNREKGHSRPVNIKPRGEKEAYQPWNCINSIIKVSLSSNAGSGSAAKMWQNNWEWQSIALVLIIRRKRVPVNRTLYEHYSVFSPGPDIISLIKAIHREWNFHLSLVLKKRQWEVVESWFCSQMLQQSQAL